LTKSVYICGDSFYCSDQESIIVPWHEQIACTRLAIVCASNLLISLQVERAIGQRADFIIVGFTSSLRSELMFDGKLVPFSWLSLDETTPFDQTTINNLKQLFDKIDLDTAVKRNELIIEATLQRLVDSAIPFLFDQGGFEHKSYGGVREYFTKFNQFRSKVCLWDHADTRTHRPYFHITDQSIHTQIGDYYANAMGIRR
jgi:hypothetical protein